MKPIVENLRILVTGGAGFIGSNLVDALLEQGNEVVVLDNFSTGRMENLIPATGNPRFKLIVGDIRDEKKCRAAVEGVDYVLHQAALGSVPRSIDDPLTSWSVNVGGFANMVTAAKDAGVKRFIYASSSSVYGDDQSPVKCEARVGEPLSPYAASKRAQELFALNISRVYGFETIGLRYFNVFGPRQTPNGPYAAVIPKFATALLRHQSPIINGDGSFSRDFTYVDNVVRANELAVLADKAAADRVYNIAYGRRTTLNELFRALRRELSKYDPAIAAIEPEFAPVRAGDIPHSLASVELAEKLLGYVPEFSAEKGFELASRWYFEHLKDRNENGDRPRQSEHRK